MSFEDIEKEIDEILKKAELEKMRIIESARRRAKEILEKPFILDEAHSVAKELVAKAEKEAEELVREAERKAMELKRIDPKVLESLVEIIVRHVTGVD